jgi:predicted metal-dependent hydrolase
VRGINHIDFYVHTNTSAEQREAILDAWYREQLREIIPPIIDKWQTKLGVELSE